MSQYYIKGQLLGEPDPPVDVMKWIGDEIRLARKLDPRPEVYGRIAALREVRHHLQRVSHVE